MTYAMKPLSCDPARIKGMSERLIISHYENNYGGAVKRLNLIGEKLAELDYANAPGFLINGLKREELVAMNSMILHEHFFDSLGDQSEPDATLQEALTRDFGSPERWRAAMIPAVSHPAVPPPTMHIDRTTCPIANIPADNCWQPRFINQADEEIVAPIRRKRESNCRGR